ncbi:MAG: hypothetical protein KDJ47_05915 [Hyphomicrobiaceae bacterium]|nr:hypothetical protein [Hyphomicrobiaceae bacterium]
MSKWDTQADRVAKEISRLREFEEAEGALWLSITNQERYVIRQLETLHFLYVGEQQT